MPVFWGGNAHVKHLVGGFGEIQSVPPGRAARPPAPLCLRSRAHIYGYGRSLRPPQGTTIAPRRRAVFRQPLLVAAARNVRADHEQEARATEDRDVEEPDDCRRPDR